MQRTALYVCSHFGGSIATDSMIFEKFRKLMSTKTSILHPKMAEKTEVKVACPPQNEKKLEDFCIFKQRNSLLPNLY